MQREGNWFGAFVIMFSLKTNMSVTVVDNSHFCFLKPDKFPQKTKTFQENGKHITNLIVAKLVCVKCLDKLENKPCYCESVVFRNNYDFCNWVFSNKKCIAVNHNFRGYNGLFIIKYILQVISPFDSRPKILLKS